MIKYVPFLKAKQNEIIAVGRVSAGVSSQICPFLDFPRKGGDGYKASELAASIQKTAKSINRHFSEIGEFYVDTYDLDESLAPSGMHSYRFILENLVDLPVIPVVAVDRSEDHIDSVSNLKDTSILNSDIVAFRVTPEEFENYASISDEIEDQLSSVFSRFEQVDLLLDCRCCQNADVSQISQKMVNFSTAFCQDYLTRRVVTAGSSIPASVSELMSVESEMILPRKEVAIFNTVKLEHGHANLLFGDYATVSPNYSDVNIAPEMLQNVMTAKLIYSFEDKHFFVRGGAIKTKGREQYATMAKTICDSDFFRGEEFSSGEFFLIEKSQSIGAKCMPGTVIKPAIISHITYAVNGMPI